MEGDSSDEVLSTVGSRFSEVVMEGTGGSEGYRSAVELVKKGRDKFGVIWNLETDESFCVPKILHGETHEAFLKLDPNIYTLYVLFHTPKNNKDENEVRV